MYINSRKPLNILDIYDFKKVLSCNFYTWYNLNSYKYVIVIIFKYIYAYIYIYIYTSLKITSRRCHCNGATKKDDIKMM